MIITRLGRKQNYDQKNCQQRKPCRVTVLKTSLIRVMFGHLEAPQAKFTPLPSDFRLRESRQVQQEYLVLRALGKGWAALISKLV